MSHTNSTTNYNLPQFVGTDKPTWLNDVNGAMSAIDTQMKLNADSATSASTTATSAQTAVGTLANLETTAKTDTVSAINEVNTKAGQAQNSANQAIATAGTASTGVTALSNYLTLTQFTNPTASITGGTINSQNIRCASNATGSLGKIYGGIRITQNTQNSYITFATPLRPSSTITILGAMVALYEGAGVWTPTYDKTLSITTDGTCTIELLDGGNGRQWRLNLINSVIFATDFGDVPIPE